MRTTTRRYVTESEIRAAKQLDLLAYLQNFEPHELVKEGVGYHTRTHDSLKISNGMWHWFSRGIGGKTALDYLIIVCFQKHKTERKLKKYANLRKSQRENRAESRI